MEHGQRTARCDTSLVDCGSKRRFFAREDDESVYDKKPQRYAKDYRTAHLTARSDKSVVYVTNNKRLYSTFCTVEANYDRHKALRRFARPLCDSRATSAYLLDKK